MNSNPDSGPMSMELEEEDLLMWPQTASNEDASRDTQSDLKQALEEAEAELQAVYRKLWPLREQYAETFPPADLPAPRYRTDKQKAVARCPRCGGRLESEGADSK